MASISLFLAACITRPSPDLLKDPSPRQELPAQSEDITLSLEQTTHTLPVEKLNLSIRNTGSSFYTYGEFFYVEKEIEGKWYMLEIDDAIFDDFASFDNYGNRLAPGETMEEMINLNDYALTLNPGKYRLVKAFSSEATSETTWLSAEFEVVD
ncbi:immunoglobulin-like domain-containing protein [Salinicoccus bachuensis]|uniref:Immunoglobulin-like domain-containing protein n=1 Tax=Salinicoccus bachuensis TaxID=3136731 RepID=A0ABZ3CH03_9STAP